MKRSFVVLLLVVREIDLVHAKIRTGWPDVRVSSRYVVSQLFRDIRRQHGRWAPVVVLGDIPTADVGHASEKHVYPGPCAPGVRACVG